MKYIAVIFIVMACLITGLIGWPWWQSQQAYKAAEQYIDTQHTQSFNYIDLQSFPKLRKIPENIRQIENLSYLFIQNTNISDLYAISDMQSLTDINLRQTKIKDISVLGTLPALKLIDMGMTPARDLSPLTLCSTLERLDISDTHTLSLEPVTRIPSLNWLNLYRAMSDDGSQVHFETLMARSNIEIQPGNRFKENYIPR